MTADDGAVVIGLDVGTTNVKCVAYPLGAYPLGDGEPFVHRGHVEAYQDGPRHEIDPAELIDVVESTLAACTATLDGREIVAVGVSCAMHGLCALGGDDEPTTRIVTWADGRAVAEAAELDRADWHERTGTPTHPMAPFTKLVWFAHHQPDVFAGARRWVGVKALVLRALTGRLVTDRSSASGTGLVALGATEWDPAACRAVGVETDQLPPIVPVTERLGGPGPGPRHAGLDGAVVVAGAGDGPSANLGVGATAPGIAALSVGTSAAMRSVIDRPDPPDASRFVYVLDDGRWVTGGAISNAGSADDWVRTLVAPDAGDAALDELAASAPPGAEGLVMLPYLHPERAPRWDATIPGAILGLRVRHGPPHFVRATVEGVAAQIGLLAESLAACGPLNEIRATGGVFASPLWRRIIGAALAQDLVVLDGVEAGCLGAAALALRGIDEFPTPEAAVADLMDLDARRQVVEPEPDLVAAAGRTRAVIARHLDR